MKPSIVTSTRAVVWVALAGLACTPSTTKTETGPEDATRVSDSQPRQARNEAGSRSAPCPGSFADAQALALDCSRREHWGVECHYDAGSCWCGLEQRCSGVAVADVDELPRRWRCEAAPPAVRPDGCPGLEPRDGSPCGSAGLSCGYGECGGVVKRCNSGRWETARHIPPPP